MPFALCCQTLFPALEKKHASFRSQTLFPCENIHNHMFVDILGRAGTPQCLPNSAFFARPSPFLCLPRGIIFSEYAILRP